MNKRQRLKKLRNNLASIEAWMDTDIRCKGKFKQGFTAKQKKRFTKSNKEV